MTTTPGDKFILFATDLAPFDAESAKLRALVAETTGHELGSQDGAYIASFPATPEGLNNAVILARKIRSALRGRFKPATGIHCGVAGGDDAVKLLAIKGLAGSDGICVSQTAFALNKEAELTTVPIGPQAQLKAQLDVKVFRIQEEEIEAASADSAWRRFLGRASEFASVLTGRGGGASGYTMRITVVALVVALGFTAVRAKRFFDSSTDEVVATGDAGPVPPPTPPAASGMSAAPVAATAPSAAPTAPSAAPVAAAAPSAAPTAPSAAPVAAAAPSAAPTAPSAAPVAAAAPSAAPTAPSAAPVAAAAPSGASAASPLSAEMEATMIDKCSKDSQFCMSTAASYLKSNPATAAKFLDLACGLNLPSACLQMGYLYQLGTGVELSETKAAVFFQKACMLRQGKACTELGVAYWRGLGVPRSPPRASAAFEQGCKFEDGESCLALGLGLQAPIDGAARAPASVSDFLTKGCQLLKIQGCQ